MRTLPAGMAAELAKRGRSMARAHLVDVQRADGSAYFWSDFEGVFLSRLTGANQQYKPWITNPPTIKMSRSLKADNGEFHLQNLSGTTIDREVAALIKGGEFEGAYVIYRPWYVPLDAAPFEFHGFLSDGQVDPAEVIFRMLQLFQPNDIPAYDFIQTVQCHFRFTSAQCGYRRGQLFVGLTTATTFSANTIGASGLALTPDLFKDELVMILSGTGAGQERFISTHTATTFTLKTNWTTNPDGTSKFIVTGPGAMIVATTLADIFSSTTIGKTALGRTADQDKGQSVAIISGTGAGQDRQITTNSTTTYTVTPAWTTIPDGTSNFIVVFRTCPKDRASCNTRGVLERFPGIIHLQPQITGITGPTGVGLGGGGGGGRCFTGNTRVRTAHGPRAIETIAAGDVVLTSRGLRPVGEVKVHDVVDAELRVMGGDELVTPEHLMVYSGAPVRASDVFLLRRRHTGKVYNLHIETAIDDERNYMLENGHCAHNLKDDGQLKFL
jgi:hypothetical protein